MKRITKIISVLIIVSLMITSCVVSFSADGADKNMIRVTVRNDVYSKDDGAVWDGVLLDEWVECGDDATAVSVFLKALENNGYTQTGAENGYITEINGLKAGDGGIMSGWSFLLNDWFTDEGIDAYTIGSGKLGSGDELEFCYSNSYGADLDFDWSDNTASLKSVEINGEMLTTGFDSQSKEHVLRLRASQTSLTVRPFAKNKMFQTRVYKNEYQPELTGYKRSENIPVVDGDLIIVGVGDQQWPSMGRADNPAVYKFRVETVEDGLLLSVDDKIKEMADYYNSEIMESETVLGAEWPILTLFRTDNYYDIYRDRYLDELIMTLDNNQSEVINPDRSTDNSKAIMVLSSMGIDARGVGGYDLVKPLSDFEYIRKQGVNGCIYALIALDTYSYEVPENSDKENATTRERLINEILSNELPAGGWTWFGDNMEPDLTGMAIISLAPYYDTDENVKNGVDKAVERLSLEQDESGRYLSWGAYSSENLSQVIIGLSSEGIDSNSDERFVKKAGCVDALMEYSVENGFSHENDGVYNSYASEQGFQALVSYQMLKSTYQDYSLYDMRDVSPTSVKFDVDGDGYVTVADATVIQMYLANLKTLPDSAIRRNCGKDESFDIVRATRIQMFLAKLS